MDLNQNNIIQNMLCESQIPVLRLYPRIPTPYPIKISSKNSETNPYNITIKQTDLLDPADCVRVVRTIVFTELPSSMNGSLRVAESRVDTSTVGGSGTPHPLSSNPAKKCVHDGNLTSFMRNHPPTLLNIYRDVHRG